MNSFDSPPRLVYNRKLSLTASSKYKPFCPTQRRPFTIGEQHPQIGHFLLLIKIMRKMTGTLVITIQSAVIGADPDATLFVGQQGNDILPREAWSCRKGHRVKRVNCLVFGSKIFSPP